MSRYSAKPTFQIQEPAIFLNLLQSSIHKAATNSIHTKKYLQKLHFEPSTVLVAFHEQSLPPVIIPEPESCPPLAKCWYFHQPERRAQDFFLYTERLNENLLNKILPLNWARRWMKLHHPSDYPPQLTGYSCSQSVLVWQENYFSTSSKSKALGGPDSLLIQGLLNTCSQLWHPACSNLTSLLTELLSKLVTSSNLQQHNHKTKRKSPFQSIVPQEFVSGGANLNSSHALWEQDESD